MLCYSDVSPLECFPFKIVSYLMIDGHFSYTLTLTLTLTLNEQMSTIQCQIFKLLNFILMTTATNED